MSTEREEREARLKWFKQQRGQILSKIMELIGMDNDDLRLLADLLDQSGVTLGNANVFALQHFESILRCRKKKRELDAGVKKVVTEYGDTLKMLSKS